MRELSIYIHIPFCVRKCLYCDFLSFPVSGNAPGDTRENIPDRSSSGVMAEGLPVNGDAPEPAGERISSYVNLLKREIAGEAEKYRDHRVISVFLGGGTPSLLAAEETAGILDTLRRHYLVAGEAEITIEANPGTVTAGKLQSYITAGINRLSIGLQSADDSELARIGRIHDFRTFLETYGLAREAGFRNINIDLMAALPGQSVESYKETLARAAGLKPEHISAYSLILEEGTPLYERREAYSFPTEEEDRTMYLLTDAYLSACGYHRYEISNYAMEGYECRHNKVYWQRGDYVGFGLGAASMVRNVRWSNPATFAAYEAGERGDGPERQFLTRREQMEEFMFLGLRMMCGVSGQEFGRLFGQPIEEVYGEALCKMYRQGLLVREQDRIRLTARGIDVSNRVMAEFLFDD